MQILSVEGYIVQSIILPLERMQKGTLMKKPQTTPDGSMASQSSWWPPQLSFKESTIQMFVSLSFMAVPMAS
jgi:hypothetical protein